MRSSYNFTAKIYDPFLCIAIKPIRIAVMNMLSHYKDKTILDLCCGTGNQLKLLSKNGFKDLHCLDISDSMLDVARNNDHPIHIYNEDATKTNFDDVSIDIIIISFAIHEKDRNTQISLIKEAMRVIKKDGLILIVDFIFDDITTIWAKIGINIIERIAGKEHYNNFKNYIQNKGLSGLIEKDKMQLLTNKRKLLKGVTISIYKRTHAV